MEETIKKLKIHCKDLKDTVGDLEAERKDLNHLLSDLKAEIKEHYREHQIFLPELEQCRKDKEKLILQLVQNRASCNCLKLSSKVDSRKPRLDNSAVERLEVPSSFEAQKANTRCLSVEIFSSYEFRKDSAEADISPLSADFSCISPI